jgi:hypothetical protein
MAALAKKKARKNKHKTAASGHRFRISRHNRRYFGVSIFGAVMVILASFFVS